tara:strand:- start:465 stop:908 length:444 start_codon:yes stop_codon:yes gene_type:complete
MKMEKLLNMLPDDLIDNIYSRIYYVQNKNLLDEIKINYYIKKKYINNNKKIRDIYCCIIFHFDEKYFKNLTFEKILELQESISKIKKKELIKIANKYINKANLEDKYRFIFFLNDFTIRKEYNYIYIKNRIDNILNIFYKNEKNIKN